MECSRSVVSRTCMNQKSPPLEEHTFLSLNLGLCPHCDPDMWLVATAKVPLQSSKGSYISNNAHSNHKPCQERVMPVSLMFYWAQLERAVTKSAADLPY